MTSYLILGGCGFIGRNLVNRLANDETCSKIVVCDKSRPELAWLTKTQLESFSSPKVIFKQINLSNEVTVSAFLEQHPCDVVINAGAETRPKMSSMVYEVNTRKLGQVAAEQAVKMKAKKFIQLTSAKIKILDKKHRSDSLIDLLNAQKNLEEDLKQVNGLNYTIIRPVLVYGSGDKYGLTPLLIVMGIYKRLKEELQLLWNESIRVNTVHVEDVVSACLHASKIEKSGEIFEIADKSNSTQGSIANIMSEIFNIKYQFLGKIKNKLAETFFEDVVEEINQKHMLPWAEACKEEGINNTPLNPYVTQEQLILDDFQADSKNLESTGFVLQYPQLESAELLKIINEYIDQKLFPKNCAP